MAPPRPTSLRLRRDSVVDAGPWRDAARWAAAVGPAWLRSRSAHSKTPRHRRTPRRAACTSVRKLSSRKYSDQVADHVAQEPRPLADQVDHPRRADHVAREACRSAFGCACRHHARSPRPAASGRRSRGSSQTPAQPASAHGAGRHRGGAATFSRLSMRRPQCARRQHAAGVPESRYAVALAAARRATWRG